MPVPRHLSAPRYLVALFAAVTLLPACALIWLAWRLVEEDHVLERQQQADQLDRRADHAVIDIQQQLTTLAHELPLWITNPPAGFEKSGAALLQSSRGRVTVHQ